MPDKAPETPSATPAPDVPLSIFPAKILGQPPDPGRQSTGHVLPTNQENLARLAKRRKPGEKRF